MVREGQRVSFQINVSCIYIWAKNTCSIRIFGQNKVISLNAIELKVCKNLYFTVLYCGESVVYRIVEADSRVYFDKHFIKIVVKGGGT